MNRVLAFIIAGYWRLRGGRTFQDLEGTIPAAKDGDPVALWRGKAVSSQRDPQKRPSYRMQGVEALLKRYRVVIRRDLAKVRPEAEQLDGKVFEFSEGWTIDKSDSSIYAGEKAMIPMDANYPKNAPPWIASGDLVEVAALPAVRKE